MVYKEHLIEIWVNGNKLELVDQKSVNIRFNRVLFDPTKIVSSQAEYSFEFEVPATPHNNKIFDYANNLSKTNKFHQRYKADVYADGDIIFEGTVVVNEYKDKMYNLNLVSVKTHSLEDIFGDKVMTKIDWKIPFEGGGNGNYTMDYYNNSGGTVTFPLVSYGVFEKEPYNKDEVASDYTSKFDFDKWNQWYVESFPPSANMLETVKRAFNTFGYTVGGNVFENPLVNSVYLSTNLADGQSPDYNVGNPKFGLTSIRSTLNTTYLGGVAYEQELQFPYQQVYAVGQGSEEEGITSTTEYNFSSVKIYDILSGGTGSIQQLVDQDVCYMYQPNESLIIIPADGFYKIELDTKTRLSTAGTIRAKYFLKDVIARELYEEDIDIRVGLSENTPVEIQLVRNYDDNLELIKGKNNRKYENGNPNDEYYEISGRRYENIKNWQTCYPHEDPYNSELPSEKNDLGFRNTRSNLGGRRSSTTSNGTVTQDSDGNWTSGNEDTSQSGNFVGWRGGQRGGTRGGTIDMTGGGRNWSAQAYGYINKDGQIMAFDQAVSENFICGFSSMLGGTMSVMKDGYSWSPINSTKNESFYNETGYDWLYREEGTGNILTSATTFGKNAYYETASMNTLSVTDTTMEGHLCCIVHLNKNDILQLFEVHRQYETEIGSPVNYSTTTEATLKIRAFSPRSYYQIKAESANTYDSEVEFDDRLDVAGFFNRDTKIVDFVNHVIDAYNLDLSQDGNTVTLDTKKKLSSALNIAVDIDDRVNADEATAEMIEYPRSMAVRYKINGDEWGFERSAVDAAGGDESILDEDGWQKYADSGYTVMILNDDTYATQTSDKSLQFSYTWYDDFNWYEVGSGHQQIGTDPVELRIPVISKFSYMIDGYDYEESMKHDGFGFNQRFWYRPTLSSTFIWTDTFPQQRVTLYLPQSVYQGVNLSYKNTEISVLTEFFNVNAYLASNYVELEVYLTPEEYNRIKNGSLVHFDSDLYYPVELSGFDASGTNPTTLKIMKKVV